MSETEKKPDDQASHASLLANTQTHLAWLRTRMSVENALASWVRTATSLIGFGFAIVQIFGRFNESLALLPPKESHLARYVGLVFIGIGSLATGIAVWEYRKVVRYLEGENFRGFAQVPGMRHAYLHPALGVAIILCLVGLLAFFGILVVVGLP